MVTHALVQTDAEGVIVRWDEGARSLFGYSSEAAIGRPVDILIPPALRDAHWRGFRRAMLDPRVKDLAADLPVVCADGRTRVLAGRLLVLSDPLGRALGALAIFVDEGSTGNRPFG